MCFNLDVIGWPQSLTASSAAPWAPLLGALGAALLASLLVASGPSLRRTALLVAVAAITALSLQISAAILVFGPQSYAGSSPAHPALSDVYPAVESVTSALSVASWAVVLVAAARLGRRTRLNVLAPIFALTLALQIAGSHQYALPVLSLWDWAYAEPFPRFVLYLSLVHLAAPVALACAFLSPKDRPAQQPVDATHRAIT
jgi:hypothetical protein